MWINRKDYDKIVEENQKLEEEVKTVINQAKDRELVLSQYGLSMKSQLEAKDAVIDELNKRNAEKGRELVRKNLEIDDLKAIIKRKNQPRDEHGHFLTTKQVATPSQN